MVNTNFAATEQLAGHQGCQDCKEKNLRHSLERDRLGKGLAIFLLIPLLCWAMLVFTVVLPLPSCSCTMFGLVLHNLPILQISNLC